MSQFAKFLSITLFLFVGVQLSAQYCSKYKGNIEGKRLQIEDFRSESVDIIDIELSLDFTDMSNSEISGHAEIKFEALKNDAKRILFDFEGLTTDSVVGEGVVGFQPRDSQLLVDFDQNFDLNQEYSLTIYYHGSPMKDASGWGGFYFNSGYAWNLGVGFADDPHSYGRIWFPCFDNFIERNTYIFHITTDTLKRASCNGILDGVVDNLDGTQTFNWSLDQAIPSYLANVAVANYEILEWNYTGPFGSTPVQVHAKATDTSKAKSSFIHLDDAINSFENAYGVYRFDKVGYSLVPFNSGAMEHATNITYPIYAVAGGGLGNESLMSHELAHMWWGDNVTCQTDGDMWINEGWASFSEYLFDEHVYGRETYEEHMLDDLRYMLQYGHHFEEFYRPVSGQPHEYVYGDHVYKKGALVAHNLRGYLGDDDFFDACEGFMDHYQMAAVSSDSMEKYFSEHTGEDLSHFFGDWVFSGGYNVVVLDSFSSVPDGDDFSLTMYFQPKLKGREDFHSGVPVYYTVYDEDWNSQSGKVEMSGSFAESTVSTSLDPAYVALYDENQMAQARTRDRVVIEEIRNLNLDNMFWDVEVNSNSDSALVYFDHVWSYPDPIKQWSTKAFTMSSYHYWTVGGIDLENVEMSATFFYDGRSSGSAGYLDIDLVGETEDSLILLHRSSSSHDWEEYEFYEKNILGLSNNALGIMQLSKIKPGDYVLANQDQSALGMNEKRTALVEVFPNPSSGKVTFQLQEWPTAKLSVFDSLGRNLKFQKEIGMNSEEDFSEFPEGVYHYVIQHKDELAHGKFILSKD
ncbi:MAG: T9SS type A sorting domain-containing protein [Bacteroidetes bacterium]|nr:T9SS type A sorting domain-containing protein [Bacteroidota bacterium]